MKKRNKQDRKKAALAVWRKKSTKLLGLGRVCKQAVIVKISTIGKRLPALQGEKVEKVPSGRGPTQLSLQFVQESLRGCQCLESN